MGGGGGKRMQKQHIFLIQYVTLVLQAMISSIQSKLMKGNLVCEREGWLAVVILSSFRHDNIFAMNSWNSDEILLTSDLYER